VAAAAHVPAYHLENWRIAQWMLHRHAPTYAGWGGPCCTSHDFLWSARSLSPISTRRFAAPQL